MCEHCIKGQRVLSTKVVEPREEIDGDVTYHLFPECEKCTAEAESSDDYDPEADVPLGCWWVQSIQVDDHACAGHMREMMDPDAPLVGGGKQYVPVSLDYADTHHDYLPIEPEKCTAPELSECAEPAVYAHLVIQTEALCDNCTGLIQMVRGAVRRKLLVDEKEK